MKFYLSTINKQGRREVRGGPEAKYFQNYSIWKNCCKSYLNANEWNYKGRMRQLLIQLNFSSFILFCKIINNVIKFMLNWQYTKKESCSCSIEDQNLVLMSFNFENKGSAEALETGIVSRAVGRL